jgi:GT2 family glycosyltransferase
MPKSKVRHGSRTRRGPTPRTRTVPKNVLVGYCTGGTVQAEFLESILALVLESPHNLQVSYAYSGPLIARSRNYLFERFLESDKDYFLSVDTDMVFEPHHLDNLLALDKDIVSGLYYGLDRNTWDSFPVALRRKPDGSWPPIPKEDLDLGLQRVDAVGMGFALVKREVVETLGADTRRARPFGEIVVDDRVFGEDTTFCYRAAEAGFEIWLDPETRLGHKKSFVI